MMLMTMSNMARIMRSFHRGAELVVVTPIVLVDVMKGILFDKIRHFVGGNGSQTIFAPIVNVLLARCEMWDAYIHDLHIRNVQQEQCPIGIEAFVAQEIAQHRLARILLTNQTVSDTLINAGKNNGHNLNVDNDTSVNIDDQLTVEGCVDQRQQQTISSKFAATTNPNPISC